MKSVYGMLTVYLVGWVAAVAGADRAEFTLGQGGNPWRVALAEESEEGGFYAVFNSDGELIE